MELGARRDRLSARSGGASVRACGRFLLGYSHMLRDRVARALPHWNRSVPGFGFIQGMYAFGLEEAGEYERAEEYGRAAVALNKQDGWAVHAVAHVMEMQGRAKEGADFLAAGAGDWAPNSVFAYHLWWHKALFHIDANDAAGALKLYDEKISAGGFGQALELLDGSSLLWRLSVLDHHVGEHDGKTSQINGRRASMTRSTRSTTCTR